MNFGPNLAKKFSNSLNSFTSFLNGYDDINFKVVKKCFGEINEPLKHLFNLSLENGIFPEK